MTEVVFVISRRQNAFFRELAEVLREALAAVGVAGRIEPAFEPPAPGRTFLLLPPGEFLELEDPEAWPDRRTLARSVFVTAEQPGGKHFERNLPLASAPAAWFDLNRLAVREYRRWGVPAEHLQLGYTPLWDRFGGGTRDVDVTFLGCATPHRARAIAGWGRELARLRSRVILSDNSRPNTGSSESFIAGEQKLDLLARTRVLVNLHRGPAPYFEWVRVLEAIHCGAAVVSEGSVDHEPLQPDVHLLFGGATELGEIAARLDDDEDRRRELARSAYELVRETMPMRASAERLAEAAELASRAKRGWRPPSAARARSTAIDVLAGVAGRAAGYTAGVFASRANPASLRVRAGVKELELDLIDARRRVRGLEETFRRGEPPPELEEIGSTPAHAGPAPRVSVICALYNHADRVEAALGSLAAQRFAEWELVVADDGSTDGSGEAVEAFMASHPSAPALLVRHPVNRGLPAARNAAISRARGEYVLVLDSDNELYPHCLERLVEALDAAPEAAFAYGILEQFDRSGPVGLSGYFGWEPERLVEGNYIDALALLRRSALAELGGYTEDRRLYGWEDYDLWCRIADRGGRATHVPEIVARYRLAAGSMISLTNLSIREAREALAERCPRLFEGVDLEELEERVRAGWAGFGAHRRAGLR
jgi:hypothetical protein